MASSKRVVLLSLVGVVVALVSLAVFGFRTTRVETIRRQVNERVPVGASPDDVLRFLDGEHLDHSELRRPEVMYVGGRYYDGTLLVWASKRGTWRSLLQREDVEVIFVFDESHKLARIDVFPVYTGL